MLTLRIPRVVACPPRYLFGKRGEDIVETPGNEDDVIYRAQGGDEKGAPSYTYNNKQKHVIITMTII